MSLISIVITLIIIGLLLWAVNTYVPLEGTIKKLINVVVIIAVILFLLRAFGVLGHIGDVRV